MYARVVRFTEVSPERIAEIDKRADEEGPPPGVAAKALRIVVDESQSTAVVILFFDSDEDMRAADEAMNAMDPGQTPGSRASVDMGEVRVERDL